MRLGRWKWAGALGLCIAAGCSDRAAESTATPTPEEPGTATCALCAMVVREQPAPRAQVLHRDGFRAFLCSVAELPYYVAAPSPHGKPRILWVEALRPEEGASATSTEPHPWIAAETARFVVGGPARPVMGESILVYDTPEAAATAARECGGRVLDWPALRRYVVGEGS